MVLKFCMGPLVTKIIRLPPKQVSDTPPTDHSSLLILHPPYFTHNSTPSILHFVSFNFQPHRRGGSLTLRNPSCLGLKSYPHYPHKEILFVQLHTFEYFSIDFNNNNKFHAFLYCLLRSIIRKIILPIHEKFLFTTMLV